MTDYVKFLAEGIGVIAILESFLIYFVKTRQKMLIFKMINEALWLVNLMLLGAYTGAALNLIGIGRETVFYLKGKYKFAKSPVWLLVFVVLSAISPVFSLITGSEGWYAVLPAIGSVFAVFAFYQDNPERTREVGFLAQFLWLIYSCFILNYSSIACNVVTSISAVAGIIRAKAEKINTKS